MVIFSTVFEGGIAQLKTSNIVCVLHGLFIRFPFSVCKNVHLTEENAVNICNNIFLNQAKKEKKKGFWEQVNI